jgi:preprotein translocase subunit SecA
MDHLRDATRFRGYAQKDPLQEYKKEGFALFGTTLERIAMEVTQRILHIDPDFLKRQQEAMLRAREMEIQRMRQMQLSMPSEPGGSPAAGAQPREMPAVQVSATPPPTFSGPMQAGPVAAARPAPIPGSRPVQRMPGPMVAPVPVDIKNIGRNDPCPCGSGKKFKKCHGEGR